MRKTTKLIVTDDEKGIVASIKKVLPNLKWLRCWNHLLRDVGRWLQNHRAPSEDIEVYISSLKKLFHKPSLSEHETELDKMMETWTVPGHMLSITEHTSMQMLYLLGGGNWNKLDCTILIVA